MNTCLRVIGCTAVATVVAGCGSMGPMGSTSPGAVPAAIAVPSGNTLALTLKASGFQNYECRAKPGSAGGFEWTFVAPEAALHDKSDALVGRHYGGPTWEHGDGSKVTGRVVADAPAHEGGNIPWLLLKGTPSGSGAFGQVTYVQRLNTSGGTAPLDSCGAATAGAKKQVRYTADYAFYKG